MRQQQETNNCHFISRFLTKPWEIRDRRLAFFDVEERVIRRNKSSLRLFSKDKLNSQRVEDWLRQYVETPMSHKRDALTLGAPDALKDFRYFRAVSLMLWLQGPRSSSARGNKAELLEWLTERSEDELNDFVMRGNEDYQLVTLSASADQRFFFPSTGLFTVPVPDPGCASGRGWGLAMPVHPSVAVALVSDTVDIGAFQAQLATPNFAFLWSVASTDLATKVVIPPEVLDANDDQSLINSILFWREGAKSIVELNVKKREVMMDAYSVSGLNLVPDRALRLKVRR